MWMRCAGPPQPSRPPASLTKPLWLTTRHRGGPRVPGVAGQRRRERSARWASSASSESSPPPSTSPTCVPAVRGMRGRGNGGRSGPYGPWLRSALQRTVSGRIRTGRGAVLDAVTEFLPGGRRRSTASWCPATSTGSRPSTSRSCACAARTPTRREVDLSYARRLLQGRLDILRAEQASRRGDGPVNLQPRSDIEIVAALSRILADETLVQPRPRPPRLLLHSEPGGRAPARGRAGRRRRRRVRPRRPRRRAAR